MLTLPIKREWFDMIVFGGKQVEYRRISDYWQKRLMHAREAQGCPPNCEGLRVIIRAGYRKNAPTALLTLSHVDTGEGLERWGAVPGVEYYRLHIDQVEVTKSDVFL